MTIDWVPRIDYGGHPLYLAVVKSIADDVGSGALPTGTRLPTHRELADALGVAIGTITRAYGEAERRGLIHSQGRRGTFAGASEKESSPISALMAGSSKLIDLSQHHPTYALDPNLASALRRLARDKEAQRLLQYAPSEGQQRHRLAGASWLSTADVDVDPGSIVVTAGAQHGLLIILAAIAEAGDLIAAETVTYPGVKVLADMLRLQMVGVAHDDQGILPDAFAALCKQRKVRALYCNPTLQNPTASIMPESRRREIAEIATAHGVAIVEDEILRPLVPKPPPPISSFAADNSYLVISTSKVIAAGLRVGFVVGPAGTRRKLVDSLRTTNLALSPLPAELFAIWLDDGTVAQVTERRRQEHVDRVELATGILKEHLSGVSEFSSYLWIQLPASWTTSEFVLQAQRRGVAVTPAEIFAQSRKLVPNAVRVSLATAPNRQVLSEGLSIIAELLKSGPLQESTAI